jgi:hypothetical protein
MKSYPMIRFLVVLGFLTAAQPARPAHLALEGDAMPAESIAPADLLQFTSGGHALGFTAGGVYAASVDHALHVEFLGVNDVRPQADSQADSGGKAPPLGRVAYENLWDGVTLAYTGAGGSIYTTTYTLAPGADPAAIRLEYNAAPALHADGSLGIAFASGALNETAPVAWQVIDGERIPVDASFRVAGREVGFALGAYDPQYALTIDPALVWNTFLGGADFDEALGIALDSSGNVYIAGASDATWGAPVRSHDASADALVAKLGPSGNLIWHTFLGGAGGDYGHAVAVDGSGNVFAAGASSATWGSPVRAYTSGIDGFVAKLTSAGALSWNTFLGGTSDNASVGVAVDASGNAYAIGQSDVTWGSPVRSYGGSMDTYVAKVSSSGALSWNTFLGGSGYDNSVAIAADAYGNVYATGISYAAWGSPVRGFSSSSDTFVAKVSTIDGSLTWNTFLGGSGSDIPNGIATYGIGIYVAGQSSATWGSPVRSYAGGSDAFAARVSSTGSLTWNTFLGSAGGDDYGRSVDVDAGGNVYVSGNSSVSWGSPLRSFTGGNDTFAANLNSSGALLHNLFLGGGGNEYNEGIAVDGSGTYVAGYSSATWGSPLRAFGGDYDVYLARVNLPHACALEGMPLFDFSADCRTDVAVYRPTTGAWYLRNQYTLSYGSAGDFPVPGDYNGDGTTDIAVYRPSTGAWYIRNQFSASYGVSTDIPVPGDYNGDGTTDVAVFRPSTGAWYIRNQYSAFYGTSTDIPVPGDYNGDGMTDIAVYRPSTGAWYIRGQSTVYFGASGDIPIPGDYDGNGTTEPAVYRPATGAWYVQGETTVFYGSASDIPIPGDYSGNGTTDVAVFRPSTGAWYVRSQYTVYYGTDGDIPLPEMATGRAGTAPEPGVIQ